MSVTKTTEATFVALSGGVGGAKLTLGLSELLGERLSIVVNTGDDFEHLGLAISPDVDTTLYTLADIVNPMTGWGRKDDTWTFLGALQELGGPTWFRLGDGDLATHVDRTRRLKVGQTPTSVCGHLANSLGVSAHVLPMADTPIATMLDTEIGRIAFQAYFVREQCQPTVHKISFAGIEKAQPTSEILRTLASPTLRGIIICPSNPWLSVDPILAVPGQRAALRTSGAPIIAVSPIVNGKAIKGPTAKIMDDLGIDANCASIARHYNDLIDGFVLDTADARLAGAISVPTLVTNTVMNTREDKIALANECLAFCAQLRKSRRQPISEETEQG